MSRTVIILAAIMLTAPAQAQQRNFTGPNGNYRGSAFTHGNSITFTDERGRFSGSTITHGNTTSIYDAAGRYQGSVTTPGNSSHPLTGAR
jgi:hypothetical protein